MKKIVLFLFVALLLSTLEVFAQPTEVELCVGNYQTESEAVEQLKRFAKSYSTKE